MTDTNENANNQEHVADRGEPLGTGKQTTISGSGAPADTTTPGPTGMGSFGGGGATPGVTIGGQTTSGSTNSGVTASDHSTGMGGGPGGASPTGIGHVGGGGGTTGLGGQATSNPSGARGDTRTGGEDITDTYQP